VGLRRVRGKLSTSIPLFTFLFLFDCIVLDFDMELESDGMGVDGLIGWYRM